MPSTRMRLTPRRLTASASLWAKGNAMDIIISNSSGKPIYEQIANQIKEQIMAGSLQAGDALPSMRLLARELRISVITTKRAYEELERDGFLESVPGKGCFVAPQNRESGLARILNL